MNWKQVLTNLNPWAKKEEPKLAPGPKKGRPKAPGTETMAPVMDVEDAVKALPDELLEGLKEYKSKNFENRKLTQDMQLELMEFIARFATLEEVNEYFMTNYKVMISVNLMYQYKRSPKWKPIIKKLREKYLLEEDEVAGRHKRVRLDRADRIFNKAEKKGDLRTALQANRDSQEMVEGRNVREGDLSISFNQYNGLTDDEIKERMKEVQDKLKRVTIEAKAEVQDGPSGTPEEN